MIFRTVFEDLMVYIFRKNSLNINIDLTVQLLPSYCQQSTAAAAAAASVKVKVKTLNGPRVALTCQGYIFKHLTLTLFTLIVAVCTVYK
jgi:hypothetical protein